jgi:hypothetical protein
MDDQRDWRCSECGKLLGVLQESRLHIRFSRGVEYFIDFPVGCSATTACRGCQRLSEVCQTAHNTQEKQPVMAEDIT